MSAAADRPIQDAYLPPPISTPVQEPVDIRSLMVSEWVRDRLVTIAGTSVRSVQAALGPSEIGQACARRLAYRTTGTPIVNLPDPTKAMFGTGMHGVIAEGLTRLDGMNRYLIEHNVSYRGISGNVDLLDRYRHWMIDWKTTAKNRITQYRRDGVPSNYVVQCHIYAQGLIAQGEQVDVIALTFIPRDGVLTDIWTWSTVPDAAKADKAIDRYLDIRQRAVTDGPGSIPATPGNLCGYCPNYRPNAPDLRVACPGRTTK